MVSSGKPVYLFTPGSGSIWNLTLFVWKWLILESYQFLSGFWDINTLSTGVLFLNLTLGAPLSPTWLCCLYHVVAPFPYPSCQKKWHSFITLRHKMCECAVWSDLDYKAGRKNKETGFWVKSFIIFSYYYLLPMSTYTCADIHKRMQFLLCALWAIKLNLAVDSFALTAWEVV